jgi:hypothetical protein
VEGWRDLVEGWMEGGIDLSCFGGRLGRRICYGVLY